MKKKTAFVVLISGILLTACGNVFPFSMNVYNDDKRIAGEGNSYNLENYEQEIEDGKFHATVESMEGMDTLWAIDADTKATAELAYDIKVENGKAKLVFINADNQVTVIAEATEKGECSGTQTLDLEQGKNRVKLVSADKAKLEASLSSSEGDFYKLGFDN